MRFPFVSVLAGVALFLTLSAAGLAIAAAVMIRLPATYFLDSGPRDIRSGRDPARRWAILVLKNMSGAAVVVLGVVLSMPGIPGPGILTILLGIMLMEFPGKRRVERWLISRRTVCVGVNRLRRRYGKPPFILE
jgi:hypothetical protein